MTRYPRCGRWLTIAALVLALCASFPAAPATAAPLPFAGDDTFQIGPLAVADGATATVIVDRAYGPIADDAGHLLPGLIGASVAANADLDVSTDDGAVPPFSIAVNGQPVVAQWYFAPGLVNVFRLSVPTAALLFPKPGNTDRALTPRANQLTFSGSSASLGWLRLTVPGASPALLMAGADLGCGPTGPQPVTDTWNDWQQWLAADSVPSVAPARDGHLSIADQLPSLDNGYAQVRRMYGPDRPGLAPRVTLVGYSMGGLVARQWAVTHPGVVTQFVSIATPNAGTDNAAGFFAVLVSRCSASALHDLTPEFVAGFNQHTSLVNYWAPDAAFSHVTAVAAVPAAASGNPTDGLVPEESALALSYAYGIVWSPEPDARVLSLHAAVTHARKVYTDVRAWTQFTQPVRDARTAAG